MEELELIDYRRRVWDAYRRVREAGASPDSWHRWRAFRDELFSTHPQSAIPAERRDGFGGLEYFPYDPRWRVEALVQPAAPREIGVAHSGRGTTSFRRFAAVRFEAAGTECSLMLYWLDAYGGGVFLPFRDATSGEETYGGGRYLLDTVKGADLGSRGGRIVLDFNFSYHPSCVHDERWSCPLAPEENRLAIGIRAGERLAAERD